VSRAGEAVTLYDGRMASAYNDGRHLLPEAEDAWVTSIRDLVPPGAAIVDVGAGTGRFARPLARRFGATVTAVEPAPRMRAVGAGVPQPGVAWVAGSAEALPVRSGVADVVWLACVVHYLDLAVAGRELARVLNGAGRVLVRSTFPDRFDRIEWLRWFPAARAIDERRMPSVEDLQEAWAPHDLSLEARVATRHLVARDLDDLADRLSRRAISTLTLISDDDFARGLAALRAHARTAPPRPVHSHVDVVSFVRR
jgi:SAM-dependent methyltransferase